MINKMVVGRSINHITCLFSTSSLNSLSQESYFNALFNDDMRSITSLLIRMKMNREKRVFRERGTCYCILVAF